MEENVYAYGNVTVVIDAGHGGPDEEGSDLGASYGDYIEKDINLVTALALKDELETYQNVTVYMTREEDAHIDIADRIAYAQSVNADVVVSVHYNASEKHLFYGGEIFTSAYGNCYSIGNALAQCIRDEWIGYGRPFKEIKTRIGDNGDYYGMIRYGKEAGIPTIILEHGYIDNHIDTEVICNTDTYRELGKLDAQGIAEYYGLSKKVVLADIKPKFTVSEPKDYAKPDTTSPRSVQVTIGEIDRQAHTISYTISVVENESKLAYYGIGLGMKDSLADEDYADLLLWDSDTNEYSGICELPQDYDGYITFRVYNSYELFGDSDAYYINMTESFDDIDESKVNSPGKIDSKNHGKVSVSSEDESVRTIDETFEINDINDVEDNSAKVEQINNNRKSVTRQKALAGLIIASIFVILLIVFTVVLLIEREKKNSRRKDTK